MNFYITKESPARVESSFVYAKNNYVIDADTIYESFCDCKKRFFDYLVYEEFERQVSFVLKRKKYNNIVYSNKNLNTDIIINIKNILNTRFKKIILITEETCDIDLYEFVDDVIFFPKEKKIKIIECESFKSPLFYWVNAIKK
jgi:hypothetical protein